MVKECGRSGLRLACVSAAWPSGPVCRQDKGTRRPGPQRTPRCGAPLALPRPPTHLIKRRHDGKVDDLRRDPQLPIPAGKRASEGTWAGRQARGRAASGISAAWLAVCAPRRRRERGSEAFPVLQSRPVLKFPQNKPICTAATHCTTASAQLSLRLSATSCARPSARMRMLSMRAIKTGAKPS